MLNVPNASRNIPEPSSLKYSCSSAWVSSVESPLLYKAAGFASPVSSPLKNVKVVTPSGSGAGSESFVSGKGLGGASSTSGSGEGAGAGGSALGSNGPDSPGICLGGVLGVPMGPV